MNSKALKIAKLVIATAPVFFANCGQAPNGPGASVPQGSGDGVVMSSVVLGKVGVLSKTATIELRKLYFTAVSSAADTVRDSATVSGNSQVTVEKVFTFKPLRTWTISAVTRDQKDSVIHSGSTAAFYVKPADTVQVGLNLTSRFTMYQANFNALPDSISSTASGTGKDKLNLNRVVLKVDGVIRADSVKASGYFSAGQSINVFFDYITPGAHTVTLEAHGVLNGYTGMLYSGAASFNVAAGVDETQAVTLNWVGPTTGNGKLTVVIGKVGKLVINGGLPGSVIN